MKVKTLTITLYQKDDGTEKGSISDEQIQNDINTRIENAGIAPENLIDIKMNTQFFDTALIANEDDKWAWEESKSMVIWNVLVVYKGE